MDFNARRLWMDNRLFPGRRGIRPEFEEGLQEFVALAKTTEPFIRRGTIKCPCINCKCCTLQDITTVQLHLLDRGFMPDYYIWRYHGEPWDLQGHIQMLQNIHDTSSSPVLEPDRNDYRMDDMVHDVFGMYPDNDPMQPGTSQPNTEHIPNAEASEFYKMLEEASRPFHEGSVHSKLSVAVRLQSIKSDYSISQAAISQEMANMIGKTLHSVVYGNIDECRTSLNVESLVTQWQVFRTRLNVEILVKQLQVFTRRNTSSMYDSELNGSYLSEYMDCLVQNLNHAPRYLVKSELSLTNEIHILQEKRFLKQVKVVQKKIRFLRYLYATEIYGHVDHEKLEDLETRIQFMADNVGQFCLALTVNDRNSNEVEDYTNVILSKPPYLLSLVVLVQHEMHKIFLGELKASKFTQSKTFKDHKLSKGFPHHLYSLLMYLRNKKIKNFPNNVFAQRIDVAIEFLLVFLADVPNSVINGKRLNEVLEKVGALVGDIQCLIQNHLPSTIEDDTSELSLGSIQILERTENLKAQVEERYCKSLKAIPYQFPIAGGLSFLDSLLKKLNEMLKSESGLDFMMKPHIDTLEKELSSLKFIFRDIEKVQGEHEMLKDLQRRTINLAYEAEVAIDSILVQYNALWHLFFSLPAIIKEINHISAEVTKMRLKNLVLKPCSVVESSKHLPTQHRNHVNDEDIVGFENEAEEIIQYLIRGTDELDVIPIVGMGGQGKTTIARKVYNKDMIVSHFDCLAWCCISQTYSRIELLREIYSQAFKSNLEGTDAEIAHKLRRRLMGRRYLIVLDDMWDVEAWEDLRLSFPNGENRSRIIITTRLEKLGKQVRHHTDLYSLPFLPLDESCKLLKKKVFQEEVFPSALHGVSLAVAERCKGLPLVIILVAGIIKKKKMEESWWHQVKSSLLSYLGESEEYSLSTMQLSYDNLPDYLRPCLLYMGMFPEDHKIPVSKLISLWIAEGFVQNIESGMLEEVAEGYLMDLISSNVVMVSRMGYDGKVKYCQLHDVVLHFCLERGREEMFMLAVKGHYSQFRPSDWKERRVSFNFTRQLSKIASQTQKPFHKHLRSLIIFHGTFENPPRLRWDPFLHSRLRLIKVLDLRSLMLGVLSSAAFHPLIFLKYLSIFAERFDFQPESHLRNLETLLVRTYLNTDVVLPANFWKMETLRRVEIVAGIVEFDGISNLKHSKQRMIEESSKLENLRILNINNFLVGDADEADVLLQRFPCLQELKISFWSRNNYAVKWESLTQLQVLDCWGNEIIASKLHLPSNLKKLTLRRPHIATAASLIGGLPNLEYLKLKWGFSGEWHLGDITFHRLKFLKLSHVDISSWDASEASFPLLETLVIKECSKLEKIPLSFADIQTLKQIDLKWCKSSLKASAVKIKEEVEAIEGYDRIELISSYW